MSKPDAQQLLLETAVVAAKMNMVMGSGLFDQNSMYGVLGGMMLYFLTTATSMGLTRESAHNLMDAVEHDFHEGIVMSARLAAENAKNKNDAKTKAREAELTRAVEAIDAEADRIIASVMEKSPPEDPAKS